MFFLVWALVAHFVRNHLVVEESALVPQFISLIAENTQTRLPHLGDDLYVQGLLLPSCCWVAGPVLAAESLAPHRASKLVL